MSNPLVNRWGSNVYWLRNWYSDIHYSSNLKHDILIEHLLSTYFFFGATTCHHIFYHKYWYLALQKTYLPKSTYLQRHYFRTFSVFDVAENKFSPSLIREKTTDFYRMRLWILKFSNWLVVNSYWFQPLKKKMRKRRRRHLLFFRKITKQRFRPLIRLKAFSNTSSLQSLGANPPYIF